MLKDICIKNNYNLKNKLNYSSKRTIVAGLYILKDRYTENNLASNYSSIGENSESWSKSWGKFRYSKE